MRLSARFVSAAILGAISLLELACGVWWAPLVAGWFATDPTRLGSIGVGAGGVAGLVVLAGTLVVALLTAGSSIGVATGHPAGWWMGVVSSCLWLLSGCAPVALLSLGILLLPQVRVIAFPPVQRRG